METPSLNINYAKNSYSRKDVLSAFRETSEKNLTIHQGMSVQEISEVVSERMIISDELYHSFRMNCTTLLVRKMQCNNRIIFYF